MNFLCSLGWHNLELKKVIVLKDRSFFYPYKVVKQWKCSNCDHYEEISKVYEVMPLIEYDELINE